MFELPEYATLARQMQVTLTGKTIRAGRLGNSPHKFVWYNRTHDEFAAFSEGRVVGPARFRGRWLSVPLEPGYVLLFGECGGKILYHPSESTVPDKYHLWLTFEDGSALTAVTQMWGAMELYEAGQEQERVYIKGMRTTPIDPEFTPEYFAGLVASPAVGKRSAKGLLTQEQLIPGLGNAIAQDILFEAGMSPRHPVQSLDAGQLQTLYQAIVTVTRRIIEAGGRKDEFDLFGTPGGYQRIMDSRAVGAPCPRCGATVQKMQYLGGACYFCPACQL